MWSGGIGNSRRNGTIWKTLSDDEKNIKEMNIHDRYTGH
jgi:hypothetical protein